MSHRSSRVLSSLLLAASLAAAGSAWAQHDDGDRSGRGHESRRGDNQNLAESVRRSWQQNQGSQVLRAERIPYDGRTVNQVRMVDPTGRVRTITDDPQQRGRHDDRPTRRDDNDND